MKKFPHLRRVIILVVAIVVIKLSINRNDLEEDLVESLKAVSESLVIQSSSVFLPPESSDSRVATLVTVCCGYDRIEEAATLFKSAIATSTGPLRLVAVTDHTHHMERILMDLVKDSPSHNLTFLIVPHSLPGLLLDAPNTGACVTVRFFLASLLPSLNQVVYMDCDTILLQPIQMLWSNFSNMSSTQIIAAAEDNPLFPPFSYYNTSAILPFPSPTGFNSGVLLLNLHQMRRSNFEEVYWILWKLTYRYLVHDDQDILNIIAYYRPQLVLTLKPQFNFTPLYCWIYSNLLTLDEKERLIKANIIHGVGGEFHPPGLVKTFNIMVMHFKRFFRNKYYYFHLYKMLGTFKGPRVSALWDVTEHISCRHRQIYRYIKSNQIQQIKPQILNNNSYINILCDMMQTK